MREKFGRTLSGCWRRGRYFFDKNSRVIDYQMLMVGTRMNCGGGWTPWNTWVSMNCGGGWTPWNTWVSNEEYKKRRIWQVDPYGRRSPQVTSIGNDQGWWESFAYSVWNSNRPRLFATEDASNRALVRYTPSIN